MMRRCLLSAAALLSIAFTPGGAQTSVRIASPDARVFVSGDHQPSGGGPDYWLYLTDAAGGIQGALFHEFKVPGGGATWDGSNSFAGLGLALGSRAYFLLRTETGNETRVGMDWTSPSLYGDRVLRMATADGGYSLALLGVDDMQGAIAAPEPATILLTATGLLALRVLARRRRRVPRMGLFLAVILSLVATAPASAQTIFEADPIPLPWSEYPNNLEMVAHSDSWPRPGEHFRIWLHDAATHAPVLLVSHLIGCEYPGFPEYACVLGDSWDHTFQLPAGFRFYLVADFNGVAKDYIGDLLGPWTGNMGGVRMTATMPDGRPVLREFGVIGARYVTTLPEPGAVVLTATGLVLLGVTVRLRSSRRAAEGYGR